MNLCISIVSHRHGHLLPALFSDLKRFCSGNISIVLTLNVPEQLPFDPNSFGFPVKLIENAAPLGFAANHNQALKNVAADYYCVLNPDIRLKSDPFPALIQALQNPKVGVVAPRIVNSEGQLEDNARRFPTALRLLKRALSEKREYADVTTPFSPEWVAGMCMLFRREAFEKVQGFDEGYFLYVEDADLCYRLRRAGFDVQVIPAVTVIHDAARASHIKLQYLKWHLTSLFRFYGKYYFAL